MKRGITLIIISILTLAIISTTVLAHYHSEGLSREAIKQLAKAKSATARYSNVRNAIRDGYISTISCIEDSELGAMGIHYVKPSLVDENLNVKKPEVLVYIPTKRGLKLVALEYFIPKSLVPENQTLMLFGRPFNGPMPGHMEGQPEHYDLHAWMEKNPSGTFNDWNPNLHCPDL